MLHVAPLGFLSFSTGGYVPAGAIWLDGSADYLSWTPSGASDDTTAFTISFWVKRNEVGSGAQNAIFTTAGTSEDLIHFNTSDQIDIQVSASTGRLVTNAVYRDPTAWQHHVFCWDSDNGTAGNRLRHWVNGVETTSFATDTNPSSGAVCKFGTAVAHNIGRYLPGTSLYADLFLAEFIFADGLIVTDALDFGEFDANGNWVPVDPSGLTFGTNGFWLDFADSADLGNDVSGNGNDFTPTSITSANSTSDRPADDAANDLGNYATLSPINKDSNITLSLGNTKAENDASAAWNDVLGTIGVSSGRWYWEMQHVFSGNGWDSFGIIGDGGGFNTLSNRGGAGAFVFDYSGTAFRKYNESTSSATYWTGSHTTGDVIGFDLDADNQTLELIIGGTARGTVDISGIAAPYFPFSQIYQGGSVDHIYNFGQSAFSNTPPSGAKAISTANLPAPTVTDPSVYFKAVTYTGTGSARSVTGVGFQPDFVWVKNRDATDSHVITDVIRGVQAGIFPDGAVPEYSDANYLTSFDSDGFSVGTQDAFNASGENIVAWCLKAGGAGSTNTNGTITSTVSVADHGGFSIGTYTGTGANATVGHGLSSNPDFFIIKCTDQAYSWACWHKDLATGDYVVYLNTTAAQSDQGGLAWQSNPIATSGVITLGSQTGQNSVDAHVFYAFARTPGLIGIGSYVGNGSSTDGPYVAVDDGASGFRPAFLLIKNADGVRDWQIYDNRRPGYNVDDANAKTLQIPTLTETNRAVDFTANGFKPRTTAQEVNNSGNTLIYLAFAEYPFGGDGVSQAKAR